MAYRSLLTTLVFSVILWGCGEDPAVGGPFTGTGGFGTGGAGTGGMASGGTGGMGTGGNCGLFGCAGTGGTSTGGTGGMGTGGTGGMGTGGTGGMGTGGTGGMGTGGTGGGTGGTGGSPEPCNTNNLCKSCPNQLLCDSNLDCVTGYVCIDTGCTSIGDEEPIKQCMSAPGGACIDNSNCLPDYECLSVPLEGNRCVKTTPGCNSTFDCVMGFSCEGGACVDRRMACVLDEDCPVSHACETVTTHNRFCVRVHRSCEEDFDCDIVAPHCADIDGDGDKECAGAENPSAPPCVNSDCTSSSAPVCEVSLVGSITSCGQYGLCLTSGDCASGFECLGLWPDGHKECVPTGGSCDYIADCPIRQVCASARSGGPPSCQAGTP